MLDDQKELFIVVDEKDTILEYRTRYDCHHDQSLLHRGVSIILSNEEGKIALQKRSIKKDTYPGMYTVTASGHVTKGQSYEEAAYRELKEEVGITVPLSFIKKYLNKAGAESQIIELFIGKYNGLFQPSLDEVDKVQFFSQEEIRHMTNIIAPKGKQALVEIGIL